LLIYHQPTNMIRRKKEITPDVVVKLLINSALVVKLLTDYPEAEARLNRALKIAEASGQKNLKNKTLAETAALYYLWGKFDEGLALAQQIISASGTDYNENQASALNTSGNIHLRLCEFDLAEKYFRQALEFYGKLQMDTSIGIVTNNIANIYNVRGDYQQAYQLYLQALDCFEKQGDIFRTAHAMHAVSQMLLGMKKTDQAKDFLSKSLVLRKRIQDYRGMVNNLLIQIGIFTDEKDFEGARKKLRQADEIIAEHKIADPHLKVYREGEAGIFYFFADEYNRAEECFLRLINLSQQMKLLTFLAGGYSWLGKTRVFRDGNNIGISDIRKGVELADSGNLPYELKSAWIYLAECYSRLGNLEMAEQAAQNYAQVAIKQGTPQEEVDAEMIKMLSVK